MLSKTEKSIKGHMILILISIVLMFISLFVEYAYPIIPEKFTYNLASTMVYRILHFYIFTYCVLFLVLFSPSGLDGIIFLIFNLILNIQWCVFQYCILSVCEINNYGCDHRKFSTKFHPYIYTFLRGYSELAMDIVGLIILMSIMVILYCNREIFWTTKALYVGVFAYSVYICMGGTNHIQKFVKDLMVLHRG